MAEPLPGLEADGYAAQYAVARASSLEPLGGKVDPIHALSLPASLACDTIPAIEAEPGVDRVLVLGSGAYGSMVSIALMDAGYEVLTAGSTSCTPQTMGARVEAGQDTAVIVAAPGMALVSRVAARARLLVVHPYLREARVEATPGRTVKIHVPRGAGGCWRRLLGEYLARCGDRVKVMHELAVPPPLTGLHAYIIDLSGRG